MEMTVQITIKSQAGGPERIQEVARLERGPLRPDTVGLSLAEARSILAGLEQTLAERQAAEFVAQACRCPQCGQERACKGHHPVVFRTPFGKLKLASPRLYRCGCESDGGRSFSPLAELLPERTSPELVYLETKFAALMSYGLTVKLLEEVLPIDQALSPTAIRNQVRHTARRLESELGPAPDTPTVDNDPPAENASTEAAVPLIGGLDGAYVHAQDQPSRTAGGFEVIVGKSLPTQGQASRCFGFVSRYDPEPERRVLELLKIQGLQSNQTVTFLSDGSETVRELPWGLIPQAEYLLDWFHLTTRLTGMSRMAQGVRAEAYLELGADLAEMLEHLKWNLWHGKVDRALEIADELAYALNIDNGSLEHRKLLKAVRSFETYVRNNRALISDYGQRYRQGQVISTAFVESAVNQVVSKRFVKKMFSGLQVDFCVKLLT